MTINMHFRKERTLMAVHIEKDTRPHKKSENVNFKLQRAVSLYSSDGQNFKNQS